MKTTDGISGYKFGAGHSPSHAYLIPAVSQALDHLKTEFDSTRLFDLGCGNGTVAAALAEYGWQITGVDPSIEGIAQANANFPQLRLEQGSAYDNLAQRFGQFPAVVSLEVVEHVYAPREYAKTLFDLIEPGGTAIVSTPYHSYFKYLVLALTGKMQAHLMPLKDHGHIKFWSIPTLTVLLEEAGFNDIRFMRVGRIPILAKSMLAIAQKPY